MNLIKVKQENKIKINILYYIEREKKISKDFVNFKIF